MQSIIVYRNPLEAMLWEGLMSGAFFPVIVGVVVFFVVFLIINRVLAGRSSYGDRAKYASYVSLALGAIAGVSTIYYMTAAIS